MRGWRMHGVQYGSKGKERYMLPVFTCCRLKYCHRKQCTTVLRNDEDVFLVLIEERRN